MKILESKIRKKFILDESLDDMPDWLKKYMDVPGWSAQKISKSDPKMHGHTLKDVLMGYYTLNERHESDLDYAIRSLIAGVAKCDYMYSALDSFMDAQTPFSNEFDVEQSIKDNVKTKLSAITKVTVNDVKNINSIDGANQIKDKLTAELDALNGLAKLYNDEYKNAWNTYRKNGISELKASGQKLSDIKKNIESLTYLAVIPQEAKITIEKENKSVFKSDVGKFVKDISELNFENVDISDYIIKKSGGTIKSGAQAHLVQVDASDFFKDAEFSNKEKELKIQLDKETNKIKQVEIKQEIDKLESDWNKLREKLEGVLYEKKPNGGWRKITSNFNSTKDVIGGFLRKLATSSSMFGVDSSFLIAFHLTFEKVPKEKVKTGDAVAVFSANSGEIIYQTPIEKEYLNTLQRNFLSNTAAKEEDTGDIWGENGDIQDAKVLTNADMVDKKWQSFCSDICIISSSGGAFRNIDYRYPEISDNPDENELEYVSGVDKNRRDVEFSGSVEMHKDTRNELFWGRNGRLTKFANALRTINSDMNVYLQYYTDGGFKSVLSRLSKSSGTIKDKLNSYFSCVNEVLIKLHGMGVLKNSHFNEINDCVDMLSNIDVSDKDEVENLFFLRGNNPSVDKIDDTSAQLSSLLDELGKLSDDIYEECGNAKTNKWRTN